MDDVLADREDFKDVCLMSHVSPMNNVPFCFTILVYLNINNFYET